ncbi:nucleotide exchange factor GrpE [Jeotgalibacillus proteolyticus]|uniref:Protein GrpE n=1 Tax=Jeotgalibacillus proteolyticus TaxID=2082395 RepID=A0A2S5GEY0_9BACL|nr:nucleotide exchange factor GrpE [Jeotgalibacillus proteolyticus]PPA71464.1 nucleotide exchange factor GrpE [Jeotgalibacillus proteolyticus]
MSEKDKTTEHEASGFKAEETNKTTETHEASADSVTEASEAEAAETSESEVDFEAKAEEAENRYLRLRADFDNYRRRIQKEAEAKEKYRAQSLISNILPALDNFERALNIEASDEQTQSLLKGMQMVHSSLLEALKGEGLEVIESVGQPFDPNLHQAVMQVSEEGTESNTVIEEFQKGYRLKDRVIRPSMVKVNE